MIDSIRAKYCEKMQSGKMPGLAEGSQTEVLLDANKEVRGLCEWVLCDHIPEEDTAMSHNGVKAAKTGDYAYVLQVHFKTNADLEELREKLETKSGARYLIWYDEGEITQVPIDISVADLVPNVCSVHFIDRSTKGYGEKEEIVNG